MRRPTQIGTGVTERCRQVTSSVPKMQNNTRVRPTDTACPRCGDPLQVRERAITVAEQSEPVGWAAERRFCANNCMYTADEVQ